MVKMIWVGKSIDLPWFLEQPQTIFRLERHSKIASDFYSKIAECSNPADLLGYFVCESRKSKTPVEDFLKFVENTVLTYMTEHNFSIEDIPRIFSAYLSDLTDLYYSKGFDKKNMPLFFRDFLLNGTIRDPIELKFEEWEYIEDLDDLFGYCRLNIGYVFSKILLGEAYKKADNSETKTAVMQVIQTNASQFEESKTDERMLNWLVGQCMKTLKGKGNAPEIKELIREYQQEIPASKFPNAKG